MGSKEKKVKLPAPRGPSEVVADSKILEALSETKEAGGDTAVEDIESQGYQDSGRGSDQSRKSSE